MALNNKSGRVFLLDGGFSTQLVEYIGEVVDGDPLWTSRFLVTEKAKCIRAHKDYVKAGADIITTGSYQSSIEGYHAYLGLDRESALNVMKESVNLARRGIDLASTELGYKKEVLVAGSIGPYGACLHDGSEYTGGYAAQVTEDFLTDWHRPRMQALSEAGVDILAIETIPCQKEALACVKLLKEFPHIKAWVSFSVRDGTYISNGERISDVASNVWDAGCGQLLAIGVNCLHPSLVAPLAKKISASSPEIPFIAYPNSGESYDAAEGQWKDQENSVCVSSYLDDWLRLPNLKYIGGCCRTNARDIKDFSTKIKQWNLERNL